MKKKTPSTSSQEDLMSPPEKETVLPTRKMDLSAAVSTALESESVVAKQSGSMLQRANSRSSSLFSVRVLKGLKNTNSKQASNVSVNFDSGTLFVNKDRFKISKIYRVRCQNETDLTVFFEDREAIQLRMDDTGTRRELCIYIRLFRPNAEFFDENEMEREGGVVVFRALTPYGLMKRLTACLLMVDSHAGTVTFVPGEKEKSSRTQVFVINQATQMVHEKTQVSIAFNHQNEPITALFKCSYQCLRFATWIHRLRHMATTKKVEKQQKVIQRKSFMSKATPSMARKSLNSSKSFQHSATSFAAQTSLKTEQETRIGKALVNIPLPPPPTTTFDTGETYDNTLDVWCGTWNVGEAEPCERVGWLDPMVPRNVDVVVLALQECKTKVRDIWKDSVAKHLNRDILQPKYQLLSMKSMWAIHLIIFVKSELILEITEVQTSNVATGLLGKLGNKGAVGCGFVYRAVNRFAFVSSHLAARVTRIPERESNFMDIVSGLKLGGNESIDFLHNFDHVFWLGDLNYRVDMGEHGTLKEFEKCVALSKQKRIDQLIPYDQLAVLMHGNYSVFTGFQEGKITFPPTYRMERGNANISNYNNKKNQNPSWTDRVLWRSCQGKNTRVQINDYSACHALTQSDHRPVHASFTIGCDLPTINPKAVVSNVPTHWAEILIEDTEFNYSQPEEELKEFIGIARRKSTKKGRGSVFSRDSNLSLVEKEAEQTKNEPKLSQAEQQWLKKSSSQHFLKAHDLSASNIVEKPEIIGTFQTESDQQFARNRSGSTFASVDLSDSLLNKIRAKRMKERTKDPDFQTRSVLLMLDSKATENVIETPWHRPKNGKVKWDEEGDVPPMVTLFAQSHVVERHHIIVIAKAQGYHANASPVLIGQGEISLVGACVENGLPFSTPLVLHGILIGYLTGRVMIKSHSLSMSVPSTLEKESKDNVSELPSVLQIRNKVNIVRKLRRGSSLLNPGHERSRSKSLKGDLFNESLTPKSGTKRQLSLINDEDSQNSEDEEYFEEKLYSEFMEGGDIAAQREVRRQTLEKTETKKFGGYGTSTLIAKKKTINKENALSNSIRQSAEKLYALAGDIEKNKDMSIDELKELAKKLFVLFFSSFETMNSKNELKIFEHIDALLKKHMGESAVTNETISPPVSPPISPPVSPLPPKVSSSPITATATSPATTTYQDRVQHEQEEIISMLYPEPATIPTQDKVQHQQQQKISTVPARKASSNIGHDRHLPPKRDVQSGDKDQQAPTTVPARRASRNVGHDRHLPPKRNVQSGDNDQSKSIPPVLDAPISISELEQAPGGEPLSPTVPSALSESDQQQISEYLKQAPAPTNNDVPPPPPPADKKAEAEKGPKITKNIEKEKPIKKGHTRKRSSLALRLSRIKAAKAKKLAETTKVSKADVGIKAATVEKEKEVETKKKATKAGARPTSSRKSVMALQGMEIVRQITSKRVSESRISRLDDRIEGTVEEDEEDEEDDSSDNKAQGSKKETLSTTETATSGDLTIRSPAVSMRMKRLRRLSAQRKKSIVSLAKEQ